MSQVMGKELNHELDFSYPIVKGNLKAVMKEHGFGSSDLWMVDPREIKVLEGYNVRVRNAAYEARVEEYTQSMLTIGYKKDSPISLLAIREGDQTVLALKRGHRRLEAAIRAIKLGAKFTEIPAIVDVLNMSEEDLTVDLEVGNNGDQLSAYERAILCKRMTRFQHEAAGIAKALSLSVPYVSDLLLMIDGPLGISTMVRDGEISANFAIEMLKKHGNKALDEIQKCKERASASGSKKITGKHSSGAMIKKMVKKVAPAMYEAINEVVSDPGFSQLSQENQEKIDAIYQQLKAAEDAENQLAGVNGQSTTNEGDHE